MPFWSWVGENLQAVIYGVATALLYPVLALEVVALGIVLFEFGWFTVELYRRWKARRRLDVVALAASGAEAGEPIVRRLGHALLKSGGSPGPQDPWRWRGPVASHGAQGPCRWKSNRSISPTGAYSAARAHRSHLGTDGHVDSDKPRAGGLGTRGCRHPFEQPGDRVLVDGRRASYRRAGIRHHNGS